MIRNILHGLAVAASASMACQPVWAKDEVHMLAATTSWVASYDTDGCRLLRGFGIGKNEVTLIFSRYGPENTFSLTLVGKPFRWRLPDVKLAIRFGNEKEQEENFFPGTLGEKPAFIQRSPMTFAPLTEAQEAAVKDSKPYYYYDVSAISSERQAAVTTLSISGNMRYPVLLVTGPMDKPMAALSKCIDNLVKSWGLDPEQQRNLSRGIAPAEEYGRWVRSEDYPMEMLRAGQPAVVDFRMNIDATGKPTDCHIQSTTRAKEFDNAVCRSLMKRAHFIPALDAKGQPTASFWRNRVNFVLPHR